MKKTRKQVELTKLVYVASPYSPTSKLGKLPLIRTIIKAYRNYRITKIIGKLQELFDYAFIGPITQSHQTGKYMKNHDGGFETWRTRDLTYISKCDTLWVVTLNGWNKSKGVLEEIKFAKKQKIDIWYVHPKLLVYSVKPF